MSQACEKLPRNVGQTYKFYAVKLRNMSVNPQPITRLTRGSIQKPITLGYEGPNPNLNLAQITVGDLDWLLYYYILTIDDFNNFEAYDTALEVYNLYRDLILALLKDEEWLSKTTFYKRFNEEYNPEFTTLQDFLVKYVNRLDFVEAGTIKRRGVQLTPSAKDFISADIYILC